MLKVYFLKLIQLILLIIFLFPFFIFLLSIFKIDANVVIFITYELQIST